MSEGGYHSKQTVLANLLDQVISDHEEDGGTIFNSLSILIFQYLRAMPHDTRVEYVRLLKRSLDTQLELLAKDGQ